MKKQFIVAALCSAGLITACNPGSNQASDGASKSADTEHSAVLPAGAPQPAKDLPENVLLTVNGEPITKTMYGLYFQERMRTTPNAKNDQKMQMGVLNELANVMIVAQDAKKQQLDKRPDVTAALALLRAKLLTQTAISQFAASHKPSDSEIKARYDQNYAGKSTTEYKARHILVKDEAKAKELIAKLDEGADFAKLAKENSTGPTGKNGGDLGWFDASQMVKPFADAVKTLQKGHYSKTPVKTQFGWHVILLEDTRETPPPSLETVKAKISTKLQQEALANYMKGLREKSKLEFNEKAGLKKKAPASDQG